MNDKRNSQPSVLSALMGALQGYTVLELSTLISGPYCATLLGDMGAEVIKVEAPGTGDGIRHLGPSEEGEGILYLAVNRNKKSITLALKKPEAREVLDRLIETADVVGVNFRPDIREKYGIEYDRVRAVKPDVVYLSITAFGEEGPYRLKPGTDHVFQALSGFMNISGEQGQGPVKTGVPIADMAASLYGAIGIMGALMHRGRTGEGQLLKVSLLDAVMCLQGTHITEYFITGKEPNRCGNDSPFVYPVGVFRTADGYVAVSAFNEKFWRCLCRALDLNELVGDERFDTEDKRFANRDELRPLLTERFSGRTNAQVLEILEQEDVPCGPVNTYDSLFQDPQVKENALIKDWPHPLLKTVKTAGNPIRFEGSPVVEHSGPSVLGEHTDEVLTELGFSERQIGEFRDKGII